MIFLDIAQVVLQTIVSEKTNVKTVFFLTFLLCFLATFADFMFDKFVKKVSFEANPYFFIFGFPFIIAVVVSGGIFVIQKIYTKIRFCNSLKVFL